MRKIQINLDPNSVAKPAHHAALVTSDVVAASLIAFSRGDLSKPEMPDQFPLFQIDGPKISSDERRAMYENWVLSKGFQDLARGVRETLELGFVYCALVEIGSFRTTFESFTETLQSIRRRASRIPFPKLLARVNSSLTTPLAFEQEFRSIQKVRNCFEHRGGIVRTEDLDENGKILTLSFPRMKIFYMRGSEEIEVAQDEPVEAADGQSSVQLLARNVIRTKKYELGERIRVSAGEFSEMAMACLLFGNELVAKLPALPPAFSAQQQDRKDC